MTLFGLDESHWQGALDLDASDVFTKQGFVFTMAKATQGTGYKDPHYHDFRAQAQKEGALFAAYHFLESGNVAAQYRNFTEQVSDKSIPIMLDLEAGGAHLVDADEFKRLANKDGRECRLLYLPHWYWSQIGSPSLVGWTVVSSSYPSSKWQYASVLYPGKRGSGWNSYGGVKPTIWQFGSSGRVAGYSGRIDVNAFEGTREALRPFFKDYAPNLAVVKVPLPPKEVVTWRGRRVQEALQALTKATTKNPLKVKAIKAAIKSLRTIPRTPKK